MSNEIDKLKKAEMQTDTDISLEQKESGDYKKGKVNLKGFDLVVENPKGSMRSGTDKNGKAWESEMKSTYGYFSDTNGRDGDEIDVFLGDYLDEDFNVYVIDQIDENGALDEHKVMFGYKDMYSAIDAYFDCYDDDWHGFGNIEELTIEEFSKWLKMESTLSLADGTAKAVVMAQVSDFAEKRTTIIKLEGEVLDDKTLLELKEQAGDPSTFDTLIIEIASQGGSVVEGVKIMLWFNELSTMGKTVVTIVTANAYSIASLIMLSANRRIIASTADVMVHNPMLPEITFANAEALETHAKELRALEQVMYNLYQIFTDQDPEIIKKLMDAETYLTAEMAQKYGFVDEIADLQERPKAVSVANTQKLTNMSKLTNVLNQVISGLSGSKYVNQMYYDKDGGKFEIFQTDLATYKVGDTTDLKSTEVTIAADGSVLTIDENGVITNIDKSRSAEMVDEDDKGDPLKEQVKEKLEGQVEDEKEKLADDAKMTNEDDKGDPLKEQVKERLEGQIEDEKEKLAEDARMRAKAKVEAKVKAEEVKTKEEDEILAKAKAISDARATGAKAEDVTETKVETEDKDVVAKGAKMEEGEYVTREDLDAVLDIVSELKEEIKALKSGAEMTAKAVEEGKDFEETAVKAIQAIASNVSSDFKPEARSIAIVQNGQQGSIFQNLLASSRGTK